MLLREIMKETDSEINLDELWVPTTDFESWETPDDVHRFLYALMEGNWNRTAQLAWGKVDDFVHNADTRRTVDRDAYFSARCLLVISGTSLYLSGQYDADSIELCNDREGLFRGDEKEASEDTEVAEPHRIARIKMSVGDEMKELHANTSLDLFSNGTEITTPNAVHLSGTLPDEFPVGHESPHYLERVKAVGKFIKENFTQ